MQDKTTYSVITSGKIKEGFQLSQVQSDFATLFKISEEKAGKLVGTKASLKKDIDLKTANTYKTKLEAIGLEVVLKANKPKAPRVPELTLEPMESEPASNKGEKTPPLAVEPAIETPTKPSTPPAKPGMVVCPKCALEQPEANLQCSGCGVYIQKVKKQLEKTELEAEPEDPEADHEEPPVEGPFNYRVLLVGGAAALLGAFLWKVIALATGYELGLLAWGIGGAVGFAGAMAGSHGQHGGITCGALALCAILGGKYLTTQSLQEDWTSALKGSGISKEDFRQVYESDLSIAENYVVRVTDEASLRQFIVDYGYSESYETQGITQEEITHFREVEGPRLEQTAQSPPDFDTWLDSAFQQELGDYSTFDLTIESLGIIDILFLFLGVGTAYRLGAGSEYNRLR